MQNQSKRPPAIKSSSSSSGGGAGFSFFFGYSFFFGSSLATGALASVGAEAEPIFLEPSAMRSSIFFPLTASSNLLISASSALAEAAAKTPLMSAASIYDKEFTDILLARECNECVSSKVFHGKLYIDIN